MEEKNDEQPTEIIDGVTHHLFSITNPTTHEYEIFWAPAGTTSVPLRDGYIFDGQLQWPPTVDGKTEAMLDRWHEEFKPYLKYFEEDSEPAEGGKSAS